jgi:F0F1-type ATP synthase delta subunit
VLTGKQILLTNVLDPETLGGIRLDYDGICVDDTIRHRLDSIRNMLSSTVL